jgi:hypothetical protein
MSDFAMGPGLEPSLEPDEFERALLQAMRRVEAPEGFAASVMERAANPVETTKKVVVMRSRLATLSSRAWVGGAIAAMLVLGVIGGDELHERHQREQAALATQQFEAGVRVTDQALAQTRAQLAKAGINLGD